MRTLAVILAVLFPTVALAKSQGQLTACKSNCKNIATALEMYATDWAGRYPSGLGQLTPNYLKTVPTCSTAAADTYSASYRMGTDPDRFGLCCEGGWHEKVGLPANHPAYFSYLGLLERDARVELSECQANLHELAEAVRAHRDGKGELPKTLDDLGLTLPECVPGRSVGGGPSAVPSGPVSQYLLARTPDAGFLIECHSGEHLADAVAPLHPRYDSRLGGLATDRLAYVGRPADTIPMAPFVAVAALVVGLVLLGRRR